MAHVHVVQQGDCFSSIAVKNGFLEETLWNHPSNSELKNKRRNPNTLFPGDEVIIPDIELKEYPAPTENKHIFEVKREKITFSLQVLKNDQPAANEEYLLTVDGSRVTDVTDGDGWIHQPIKAAARKGKLVIANAELEYELRFGYLDPVEEKSGVQSRLRNLGHYFGEKDKDNDYLMEAALHGFQRKHGLPETGASDAATKAKLEEVHGS